MSYPLYLITFSPCFHKSFAFHLFRWLSDWLCLLDAILGIVTLGMVRTRMGDALMWSRPADSPVIDEQDQ